MSKREEIGPDQELAPLKSAELDQNALVPERVLIAPWGPVESTQGNFIVDEESIRFVMAAFEDHGTDLPIDYEHQTLGGAYASPSGQAPAAGWITDLQAEPGVGLFATVNWTNPARQQLAAKQYRYLSPVAIVRKADRKLLALHSVALTNKPAIVGAEPIVNTKVGPCAEPPPGALGSIGGLANADDLLEELSLPVGCSPAEMILVATQRLRELKRELSQRHIDGRIADALRSGRLGRGQESWARRLIACDESLFDEWLAATVPPVSLGRMTERAVGTPLSTNGEDHTLRARSRAEYRAHPELSALTSEDAYVALAFREARNGI